MQLAMVFATQNMRYYDIFVASKLPEYGNSGGKINTEILYLTQK